MDNWIKVEDELPEIWVDILGWAINNDPTGSFKIGEKYFCLDRLTEWNDGFPTSFRTDRFFGQITHWMKLPEPPEEKNG